MKKTKLLTSIVLTTILTTGAVLAWVDLGTVNNGDTLTSTLWNNLVSKVNENGNKLNGIYNVGGNIGIGKASPSSKLDVAGSINSNYLELNASSAGEGGEMRFKGDLGYGNIQLDNYTGNFRIHTLDSGKQFQVLGGSALANAWNVTSDIRKKENIKPIENVIDKIKKIRGVSFSWKDSGKKDVGVIAQEIEKEFPEFVTTATDGYKSVDYGKLSSVLIEGVKEQQKQIDELIEKNDKLEDRLKILEKKFKN